MDENEMWRVYGAERDEREKEPLCTKITFLVLKHTNCSSA